MARLAPYLPRLFQALPAWRPAGFVLKPYAIRLDGAEPLASALLHLAQAEAAETLALSAAEEGGAEGLGYVIVHAGEDATWLLTCWWAHGDILCRRLARAPLGETRFAPQDHRPLMACVWETHVIAHENGAWIRNMMTEDPDLEGWEDDLLPDGLR